MKVSWSSNKPPPGEPGKRVEHFMRKPRHKVLLPILAFNVMSFGFISWTSWTVDRERAVTFLGLCVVMSLLSWVVWRSGQRGNSVPRPKNENPQRLLEKSERDK